MTTNEISNRLARLQKALQARGNAALVVYADGTREGAGTIRYFTGWMPNASDAILIVPSQGTAVLLSENKNKARAFQQRFGGYGRVLKVTDLFGAAKRTLTEMLPNGAVLAYAGSADLMMTRSASFFDLFDTFEKVDGSDLVHSLRLERTTYELAKHRKATEVADKMVAHAMSVASVKGITGPEIMAEVEFIGRRLGADLSTCWLAIGECPAETYFELFELMEPINARSRIQIGTAVCLDGYFAQVLRMGVFEEPAPELQRVSEAILAMQDAALERMIPGAPVHTLVDALEEMIAETCPYTRATDPFRFQSIHGMSNNYSDPSVAPFLNADRNKAIDASSPLLRENMVFEIHPNFTMPGLGHVCHGDVAAIGENGAEWLSTTPRGILRLS